ncbi:Protein Y65B4A.2, partial [Aphelenchoides avenae]
MKRSDLQFNDISSSSPVNKKCCFTLATIVVVVAGCGQVLSLVGLAVGMYFRKEVHKRELNETNTYMKSLVDRVNSCTNCRWKAKFNPFGMKTKDYNYKTLKNVTAVKEYVAHLESMFKSERMKKHLAELLEYPVESLPRHFDAREKWPLCKSLHYVPNQGGCGSCYAVSSMTVASDRACVQSNATYRSILSIEDLLGCCKVCGDCYGGDPLKGMVYWALEGVVTGDSDGCRPYSVSTDCGTPCMPDEYPKAEAK